MGCRMWLGKQINKLAADKSGAALLEVAVVIPVVLSIGLGVVEFGNAIYNEHLIFNGVRDAARYAAGLPYSSLNPALSIPTQKTAACIALTGQTNNTTACNAAANPSCTAAYCRVLWWNNASGATVAGSQVSVLYNSLLDDGTLCGTVANHADCRGRDYKTGNVYTVTVTATVPYQSLGFMSYFNLAVPVFSLSHTERLFGVR